MNTMDDKTNSIENQSNSTPVFVSNDSVQKPIFESVPVENLQPEEVAPNVETPSPEELGGPPPTIPPPPPPMHEEEKSKYVIVIAAAVVFFLLLIVIFRLIFSSRSTSKKITLTYWGLWEEKEVFTPLIQQYQQKNPNITITYEKKTPLEYREKLLARSKNGQGPDIFRFHNTWLPQIKQIASPIPSQIMSNAEFEQTFYKIHQKDLKSGDYYYGLPLEVDGLVLVYNENLFKQAGIQSSPSTWDDIITAVSRISVKDKSGTLINSGIALGTASNIEHFSDILGLLIAQNGADIKQLDQPAASTALEFFRKFAEPPMEVWNDQMPNSMTAFIQEKVAMILVPSWEILTIKSANPDIKLKVVPVPSIPESKSLSLANYWVEGVSKTSKNQIEAWKFLKFLTEKENLTKMYEVQSKIRIFGEPYSRVDLASLLIQNEYIGPVIKQAQDDAYVSLPLVARTFDNGLNDEIILYLTNAVNSTIQGVSYEEALRTAKNGIDQVFQKYTQE